MAFVILNNGNFFRIAKTETDINDINIPEQFKTVVDISDDNFNSYVTNQKIISVDEGNVVFSDEPAWCHEQKFFEDDRFLISDSGDNITDMCLMSMCQYQIMANSTYSWWGAWLSNSKDVIAP